MGHFRFINGGRATRVGILRPLVVNAHNLPGGNLRILTGGVPLTSWQLVNAQKHFTFQDRMWLGDWLDLFPEFNPAKT